MAPPPPSPGFRHFALNRTDSRRRTCDRLSATGGTEYAHRLDDLTDYLPGIVTL